MFFKFNHTSDDTEDSDLPSLSKRKIRRKRKRMKPTSNMTAMTINSSHQPEDHPPSTKDTTPRLQTHPSEEAHLPHGEVRSGDVNCPNAQTRDPRMGGRHDEAGIARSLGGHAAQSEPTSPVKLLPMSSRQASEPGASFEDLEKRIEALIKALEESRKESRLYEGDARKFEGQVSAYKHRLKQAEDKSRDAETRATENIRDAWTQRAAAEASAQRALVKLQKAKDEATSTIEALTVEHSQQTAEKNTQIRQLLETATRGKGEGKWNPPPDEDVRGRLSRLNSDMRDWAKDWAWRSTEYLANITSDDVKYLSHFVELDSDGHLPLVIGRPQSKTKAKIGAVLLHAALAHEVQSNFFSKPFFCLPSQYQAAFEEVLGFAGIADSSGAHAWRCSLWRLLNPPRTSTINAGSVQALNQTKAQYKVHCEQVEEQFMNTRAKFLLATLSADSDKQKRSNNLNRILTSATAIATSLLTQNSLLKTLGLPWLHKNSPTFNIASPVLQGHPLSKVDLDDNVDNGRKVIVIVRPALLALDEQDTEKTDGETHRVLAKAIVLLEDKA